MRCCIVLASNPVVNIYIGWKSCNAWYLTINISTCSMSACVIFDHLYPLTKSRHLIAVNSLRVVSGPAALLLDGSVNSKDVIYILVITCFDLHWIELLCERPFVCMFGASSEGPLCVKEIVKHHKFMNKFMNLNRGQSSVGLLEVGDKSNTRNACWSCLLCP